VAKNIRAWKGSALVGITVAYVYGAEYGFSKEGTTIIYIMAYIILGALILPSLIRYFLKLDHRIRRRRR